MGKCFVCNADTSEEFMPKCVCPQCRGVVNKAEHMLEVIEEAYSRGKRDGAEQILSFIKGEHNDNT